MKLRIQDNSVRLRLTRSEVDRLQKEGEVTSSAAFPGDQSLHYVVKSSGQSEKVAAKFDRRAIVVTIPAGVVREWATSESVSIHGSEPLAGNESLAILVEKDFACLAPREGEDESDMFPHPRQGEESC